MGGSATYRERKKRDKADEITKQQDKYIKKHKAQSKHSFDEFASINKKISSI